MNLHQFRCELCGCIWFMEIKEKGVKPECNFCPCCYGQVEPITWHKEPEPNSEGKA